MIKQFNKRSYYRYRKAEWSTSPEEMKDIFEQRCAFRKLVVLVDAHMFADNYNVVDLTKEVLLFSLLQNRLVEWYKYADNGPPAGLEPLVFNGHDWLSGKAYKGWAVASPFEKNGGFWPVTFASEDESFTDTAVSGNIVQLAEKDETSRAYRKLKNDERARRRKFDMLAHEVAEQALQADLFITDREYLLDKDRRPESQGLTICTLEEAITLVSLYLRAQGEFIIPVPDANIRITFNRGLFYWVATREVLPESWRWFSACVYGKNDRLLGLGGSVLSRIQRAIEARDRVHVALSRKTNNDVNDDALGNLDHVLMLLMGAIDASALVSHYILDCSVKERSVGWQNDEWLKGIGEKAPELAQIFAQDSPQRQALTILRLLRNSIHGEALKGITLESHGNIDTVLRLPKRDEIKILAAMDALGGREEWGYQPFAPGHDNIRPGILVDKLIEEVIKLLNRVMRETPVDTLPISETLSTIQDVQKKDRTFSEWNRLAIRWQLGL